MKGFVKAILLLGASITLPLTSFSWNALGHRVIANIAYQHVNQDVRDKIDKLVAYLHQEYPTMGTYDLLATWPDSIRGQRVYAYSHWHYIDIGMSTDGTPLKNMIDDDNAVWALNTIRSVISNEHANPYERARFLAFFTHIVGDLHQPLHTVTNFTAKRPNGDIGGNLFYVKYKGKRMSLHQLWDGGVGVLEGSNSATQVDIISAQISSEYPESYFGEKINDLDYNDWTDEGLSNAREYVYNTLENQELSNDYPVIGGLIAEKQIALAGYRLSEILNLILKDNLSTPNLLKLQY